MSEAVVVQVQNLGKCFKIYQNPWSSIMEWASRGRKTVHQDFWALHDISFDVRKGECLGIIGPNGSGKSTLLKILTRCLYPTTGTFSVQGNLLSLLELGTGFNAELTGRQNIYHSSQLLGFPEGYVKERIEDIEAFCEIGAFFDRPIKTYSSGMYIRLAFSMFVFLNPEVLVIDEVLSVGDIFFQQKCFAKMREMMSLDTTCLFASHDTGAVQNLCDRVILLNQGRIHFMGSPEEAVSRYFAGMGTRPDRSDPVPPQEKAGEDSLMTPQEILAHDILGAAKGRHGAGGLEIIAARVTDPHGKDTLVVPMLESLHFHLFLTAKEEVLSPHTGIHLFDRLGNLVFAAGTRQLGYRLPGLKPGEELVARFEILFSVQPGEYTFSLGASEPSEEGPNIGYIHDRHEMLGPIVVIPTPNEVYPFYGIAQLPMKVSFHRLKNLQ